MIKSSFCPAMRDGSGVLVSLNHLGLLPRESRKLTPFKEQDGMRRPSFSELKSLLSYIIKIIKPNKLSRIKLS